MQATKNWDFLQQTEIVDGSLKEFDVASAVLTI